MAVELAVPSLEGGPSVSSPNISLSDNARGAIYFGDNFAMPMQSLSWGYKSGVQPQVMSVRMESAYADKFIEEFQRDISLTISVDPRVGDSVLAGVAAGAAALGGAAGGDTGQSVKFEDLWLLPRTPGDWRSDMITVADSRWYWDRPKVTKVYNAIRKTNDVLALEAAQGVERNIIEESDRMFLENTIRFSEEEGFLGPYSALDIVIDVLVNFLDYPEERINTVDANQSAYIPQDIYLEGDSARSVVARFLEQSGNELYLDRAGDIVIYDRHAPMDEAEFQDMFQNGIPPVISGAMYVVDYEAIRPNEIEVQSRVEREILFTYIEDEDPDRSTNTTSTIASTVEEAEEQISAGQVFVENVTKTVVPDQIEGVPRGTVVPWIDALEEFGNRYGSGPITVKEFRENYGQGAGMFVSDSARDPNDPDYFFDPQAVVIWQTLMRDYRTYFRIPQVVIDSLLALNPVLADVVNPETGTRAPSEIFSTVTWVVNNKYREIGEKYDGSLLDSFKDSAGNDKSPYTPVPGGVGDVDFELGTYRVNYAPDTFRPGSIVEIIPGEAQDSAFYLDPIHTGTAIIGTDGMLGGQGLVGPWECSTIMSAVPLVPNDHRRHWRERFDPPDDSPEGNGPMVVVFQNTDTARFVVPTEFSDYANPDRAGGPPDVEDPIESNSRFGGSDLFVNRNVIKAIGFAEADRIFRSYFNQAEGALVLGWTDDSIKLKPRASVTNIKYRYNRGDCRVEVQAQRLSQPESVENLLPEHVLRLVKRQITWESKS